MWTEHREKEERRRRQKEREQWERERKRVREEGRIQNWMMENVRGEFGDIIG
jgi:hypothetical protein